MPAFKWALEIWTWVLTLAWWMFCPVSHFFRPGFSFLLHVIQGDILTILPQWGVLNWLKLWIHVVSFGFRDSKTTIHIYLAVKGIVTWTMCLQQKQWMICLFSLTMWKGTSLCHLPALRYTKGKQASCLSLCWHWPLSEGLASSQGPVETFTTAPFCRSWDRALAGKKTEVSRNGDVMWSNSTMNLYICQIIF